MILDVNSSFKVLKEHDLSGEDYYVLSQLYLPIMGIDSFSLFIYLYHLNEDSYLMKKLIDALNFNTPKLLENAFNKLEAVGLIKSYFNEQKGYLFRMLSPVSKNAFLENQLLAQFLYEQIGEVEFNKLTKPAITHIKGYKEITKSFDEVYEFKEESVKNLFNSILKIKTKADVKITNPNFDYLLFKMSFDTSFFDQRLLDDEEFQEQILSISYLYRLNEEEMKDVIMKTIEIDKDLKYEDISKNARKYYQEKNRNTKRKIVTKNEDVFLDSALDDEEYKLITSVESMDPVALLSSINGGNVAPAAAEIKMLEDLQKATNFPQSVINIMVLWVNSYNNGVLPGYSYFEKIANTWARAGVKTPLDALRFIKKQNEKRSEGKTQTKSSHRVAIVPEWYKKYQKELENIPKKEEDEVTEEEFEKILKEFNKVL